MKFKLIPEYVVLHKIEILKLFAILISMWGVVFVLLSTYTSIHNTVLRLVMAVAAFAIAGYCFWMLCGQLRLRTCNEKADRKILLRLLIFVLILCAIFVVFSLLVGSISALANQGVSDGTVKIWMNLVSGICSVSISPIVMVFLFVMVIHKEKQFKDTFVKTIKQAYGILLLVTVLGMALGWLVNLIDLRGLAGILNLLLSSFCLTAAIEWMIAKYKKEDTRDHD